MFRKSILLIALVLVPGILYCQQPLFTSYSLEEGLSQSVVNCVHQDSKGYLWAGTQNGLNRFNGYTFDVFLNIPSDTTTISNNWVYSIDEDRYGDLWICTKSGLNRFVRSENRFIRIRYDNGYMHNVANYPYDAIVSSKGKILINTPPVLTIYDPATGTFSHYKSGLEYDGAVKDNRIPLLEDTDGHIWIGSTRGLACFDPVSKSFRCFTANRQVPGSISDNSVTALSQDRSGNIWVGTAAGLNRYDKKTGQFIVIKIDPKNSATQANNFIRSVIQDNSGNFWIGTEGGGLFMLSFDTEGKTLSGNFTSENNGLSHNIVLSLFIDHSENLWIGTLQGLGKTDLKKPRFRLYSRNDSPYSVDLLGNVIASIYKDEYGILWVGNWGQGLNLYDRKTGRVEHFSSRLQGSRHLTNDYVHVIFGDAKHRIWLGTRDGMFIFDRDRNKPVRPAEFFRDKRIPDFRGLRVFVMIQDRSGEYWVGTQNGLYWMNVDQGTAGHLSAEGQPGHRISSNLVYSLLEDRDGYIWIATLNGLDVYNPSTGKITTFRKSEGKANSLCDNFVIALCEDHNGGIWIGTSAYLDRFTKNDSLFTYYSQEQGLPNNNIFEIREDARNNMWFATGRGLSRFDTITKTFKTYTVQEGLQGLEFNLRASFRSPDGEMFYGGMNGFNSFYPDSLKDNPFIPPIVFTSFSTISNGVKRTRDIGDSGAVSLRYNENTFSLEFAALEYTNPRNNKYQYRLEGVSDGWIDIGTRRFVAFTSMPAGDYKITVRGSNNDGKWNEKGITLVITIRPPWWRSWPAYVSYILALVLLIIIYIKWRERNLIRQRTVLEQKVEERTHRIEQQRLELEHLNATKDKFFSIIAHDLRSPFNSLLGLSDMLLSDFRSYDQAKVEKYLTYIRDASKQTYELLQNLLFWARSQTGTLDFRPVPFDLGERITENISVVSSQAEKKNIRIHHAVPQDALVTADPNMIDTVLRNLLSNAIKFTPKEGTVQLEVNDANDRWEIIVRDTGIGIEPENISKLFRVDSKFTRHGTEKEPGSGLGLILCKEFIERHGSTITVESRPGAGSEFRFSLGKG